MVKNVEKMTAFAKKKNWWKYRGNGHKIMKNIKILVKIDTIFHKNNSKQEKCFKKS